MTVGVPTPGAVTDGAIYYGLDVLLALLRRTGEMLPTDNTAVLAAETDRYLDAKIEVNQAYWWLCAQREWRWARKYPPASFTSAASYTVSATSIATNIVVLSAAVGVNVTGWKFMLDADGLPHRITAYTGAPLPANITLATAYTGDATSGGGTIFQDEFTVASDILAFPHIKEVWSGGEVEVIPESQFHSIARSNYLGFARGTTKRYATFLTDAVVRIAPWTTTARLFECSYNYRPQALTFDANDNTDVPIVPQEARWLIAARAEWKLANDRKDYDRAKRAQEEIGEGLNTLLTAHLGFTRPRSYIPPGRRIASR